MTVHPRLDTSPEQYPLLGDRPRLVTPDNVGSLVHLRVELQALWRLPRSNAIVFSIRCFLISLEELVTIPKWGRRLHRVLKSLHPALVDYKGMTHIEIPSSGGSRQYDDGTPTSAGMGPE